MLSPLLRYLGLLVASSLVLGCASESSAISKTLGLVLARDRADHIAPNLNPEFRYLRATAMGNTALLVLGHIDPHPQGDIEVWYSAQWEVLRLQNGRLVGTTGLKFDWRNVRYPPLPPWFALTDQEISFTREHDEVPGYRYGISEEIRLRKIATLKGTTLVGIDPESVQWFIEEVKPNALTNMTSSLPSTVYAVQAGHVVYGAQCLNQEVCITWQHWPVAGK